MLFKSPVETIVQFVFWLFLFSHTLKSTQSNAIVEQQIQSKPNIRRVLSSAFHLVQFRIRPQSQRSIKHCILSQTDRPTTNPLRSRYSDPSKQYFVIDPQCCQGRLSYFNATNSCPTSRSQQYSIFKKVYIMFLHRTSFVLFEKHHFLHKDNCFEILFIRSRAKVTGTLKSKTIFYQ